MKPAQSPPAPVEADVYDPEQDSAVAYARAVRRSLGEHEGLCFVEDVRVGDGGCRGAMERRR
jgi:hypothetical protein